MSLPALTMWEFKIHPITERLVVLGKVKGHPNYPDGDYICTSPVVLYSENSNVLRTQSTTYTLLEPAKPIAEIHEEHPISSVHYGRHF